MSKQIKAVVIDDELGSRETLKSLLTDYCPQVKVIGVADGAESAWLLIQQLQPELVFLDVRMPSADEGFKLLESIEPINFSVIFTTAFDEYAIRAIKFSALDYLLKPINILELQKAVNRYVKRRGISDQVNIKNLSTSNQTTYQKIGLPSLVGVTFVQVKDIVRCEADGNCTLFYFTNRPKILVTKTLKYYQELLDSKQFYRIHGSHLIHLKHLVRYQKDGLVEMSDTSTVYVSARKKKAFLQRLQTLQFKI